MIGRITVIVLSYNGVADTLACLDSLHSGDGRQFDIVVVDNASTDGSQNAIRRRYPHVSLLALPENLGWAGGNNIGINFALGLGADLICLLNNDTIVPPGSVETLAQVTRKFRPCLMHPAIDFYDPTAGSQLDPFHPELHDRFRRLGGTDDVFEMDYAYGACLMIPSEVFRQIGLFDERFFLQLEETDFCLRARRIGIPSLCTTRARIVHAGSKSFGSSQSPLKTYYSVRNTFLLTEKHHRTPKAAMRAMKSLYWSVSHIAARASISVPPKPLYTRIFSRNPFIVAARAGFRDYLLRRFGSISASALLAIGRD